MSILERISELEQLIADINFDFEYNYIDDDEYYLRASKLEDELHICRLDVKSILLKNVVTPTVPRKISSKSLRAKELRELRKARYHAQIDCPLVLNQSNTVIEDRKSWAWMANLYGYIKMPLRRTTNTVDHPNGDSQSIAKYKQDLFSKYVYHIPTLNDDRYYEAERFDRNKYGATDCNFRMYIPLNFYDHKISLLYDV